MCDQEFEHCLPKMYGRERYQISLHAFNLPNKGGWFRKSSPYASVKVISGPQQGQILGETEHLPHTLDPDWCKVFFLDFSSSEITHLEVTIWDYHNGHEPIWMGEARFEATSVYLEPGKTKSEQIGRSETSV